MAATGSNVKSGSLHDRINKQLPCMDLSAEDMEKTPEFCSLLSSLTNHLTPEGLSKQTQRDLKQAEEVLRHDKHTWLLNHILYLELQELLLDYELRSHDVSLSSRDQQFHRVLQQALTQAEIGDYLDFSPDPSSKVTLLGLTKQELNRQNPCKKHSAALQQALIPEMEERLRKKCENLVMAHSPELSSTGEKSKLTFAKSSQLPALVEADQQRLEQGKQLIKEVRRKNEQQFSAYYQNLMDSLSLLEMVISRYKRNQQSERDTITTEWLCMKCDTMCLKIRLVELQILCDTYTKETLQCLRIIRTHLDDAYKESEKEKRHREQALEAYESAGDDFNGIVAEYGKLKSELENKQWALAELVKGRGRESPRMEFGYREPGRQVADR